MIVEVAVQHDLASLLESHMNKALISDARLSNQINSLCGNPCFIHRSTITNWRTGSVKKVVNWRQLATVAVALGVNETEANALLQSAGCPSIQALAATMQEADRPLLAYWLKSPDRSTELTPLATNVGMQSASRLAAGEGEIQNDFIPLPKTRFWELIGIILFSMACIAVIFYYLAYGASQYQPNDAPAISENLLINPHFESGTLGWNPYVNDAAVANLNVIDGVMRIRIDQAAEKSWYIALSQDNIAIAAGKTYTVRFRVRGDGAASMHVDVTRVSDPQTTLGFDNSKQQLLMSTTYWSTKTIEFEANDSIALKGGGAQLLFTFGSSRKGWIMLDDIEFYEGKPGSYLPGSDS